MFPRALIVVLLVAVLLGSLVRAGHGAGPERTYVVQPFDTLWSIAAAHYAGDPRGGIWEIEQRNGLDSALVRPGQKLVLP